MGGHKAMRRIYVHGRNLGLDGDEAKIKVQKERVRGKRRAAARRRAMVRRDDVRWHG